MLGFSSTFVLAACYGPQPKYELAVSKSSVDFPAEGGTTQMQIMTEGSWNISVPSSFLMVSPMYGIGDAAVNITVEPNEFFSERMEYLIVSNDYETKYVTVRQQAALPMLLVAPTSLSFSGEADKAQMLIVESNTEWVVSCVPYWLSVSPNSGKGYALINVVTTQANKLPNNRQGTIEIYGKSECVSVSVTQQSWGTLNKE